MPQLEELKRQIAAVRRAVERREAEPAVRLEVDDSLAGLFSDPDVVRAASEHEADLADLREALATLERLMPPF